jgi:hypothetical protein
VICNHLQLKNCSFLGAVEYFSLNFIHNFFAELEKAWLIYNNNKNKKKLAATACRFKQQTVVTSNE